MSLKHRLVALAVGALCFVMPFAQADISPEQQEAVALFTKLRSSENPTIAAMAEQSLLQLQTPKRKPDSYTKLPTQIEVPLMSQLNNSLALPVVINQKYMATFMMDTGASHTVITPRFARKIGLEITPDTPRMTIITANGAIQAPVLTVDRVSIGGVEVQNLKVVVQELNKNDLLLSGLLGMNFFKDMEFTVRQNKLILTVSHAG